jgi:hypothetical protein
VIISAVGLGIKFYPTNRLFGHETSVSYSVVRVISGQHRKSQSRKNELVLKNQGKYRLYHAEKRGLCMIVLHIVTINIGVGNP